MWYLKKYKPIWIQFAVFFAISIFKKNLILFIVSWVIFLLPFFSKKVAENYILILERIIHFFGYWVKNILFAIVYFFIIIPIKVFAAKSKDKNLSTFIDSTNLPVDTFNKLW